VTDSIVAGELNIPGVAGTIYFGPVFLSDDERDALFADLDAKSVTTVWNVQDDQSSHDEEARHFKAAIWSPIDDFDLPDDREKFVRDLDRVLALLQAGQNVYVHCAAGHGRTGLALASILVRLGVPSRQALNQTHQATGGPETAEQEAFVESLQPYLPSM
jgi:protein-tyrosine phosphatase